MYFVCEIPITEAEQGHIHSQTIATNVCIKIKFSIQHGGILRKMNICSLQYSLWLTNSCLKMNFFVIEVSQ